VSEAPQRQFGVVGLASGGIWRGTPLLKTVSMQKKAPKAQGRIGEAHAGAVGMVCCVEIRVAQRVAGVYRVSSLKGFVYSNGS